MDLTKVSDVVGYAKPIEMPVSELLTGSYSFSIPSYQRGYRWESSENGIATNEIKQVDDLLNDLKTFVKTHDVKAKYYLQPLMVKPRLVEGNYVWDVLDGQQRLTTMLLVLKCLNEKLNNNNPLPLYSIKYENRKQLDFNNITFDSNSEHFEYPQPSTNLDCYYIRKAKDRIYKWYTEEIQGKLKLEDSFKKMLFWEDSSRGGNLEDDLRAIFIWYNVEPILATASPLTGSRKHDIEVFNRLNRGKISLTDAELIKALFLLCIKSSPASTSSLMTSQTFVRKWDEMGKKLQDDSFWKMMSPKNKEYSNRLDFLFDFIKDCNNGQDKSSYRFYYDRLRTLLEKPDINQVEAIWNEVKMYFDTLCKWHEDPHKHNYVGFLVDCGYLITEIYEKQINLTELIRKSIEINDVSEIDSLTYHNDLAKIRRLLLLFNVLTCDKFNQKFPFDSYRDYSYDVEHVNSQTDNPIEKITDKISWIEEHALPCLKTDSEETENEDKKQKTPYALKAEELYKKGEDLVKEFKESEKDTGYKFKGFRTEVEKYYADDPYLNANKDHIGNLTLLNSSINREYHNALFPKKLRTLKRCDQEGIYIPLCTKYMFLKYYSNTQINASSFSMMRWRKSDHDDYTEAIEESIKSIL